MLKTVLQSNRRLVITLTVDEQDQAQIEIQSTRNGPDLTQEHDVVALVDGKGLALEVLDRRRAVARLGQWEPLADKGFALMLRVHEYFGGWDFPPQADDFVPDEEDADDEDALHEEE